MACAIRPNLAKRIAADRDKYCKGSKAGREPDQKSRVVLKVVENLKNHLRTNSSLPYVTYNLPDPFLDTTKKAILPDEVQDNDVDVVLVAPEVRSLRLCLVLCFGSPGTDRVASPAATIPSPWVA